jgi:DNA-binding transcriptional LysR family regulator
MIPCMRPFELAPLMDLKRIRYAIALAREMNFARAAEKLHLSQPALSRSIQTLEEELGMALFDRDNRNVRLTTVGAAFLEQAKVLVYQLGSLERDMTLMRSGDSGRVAFGVGPLPTAGMLPRLVREIRRERPGLRLAVTANNWRYLLMHLRAEEIEFFIADARDIERNVDLTITPLCRQYGPFLCRPGHPLLANPQRVIRDVLPYGFASFTLPASVQPAFRQLLGLAQNEDIPIGLECDNMMLLKEVVKEDDMILLSTQASVAEDVADGSLVPLEFKETALLYAEMSIVQLNGRTLSPGAKLLLEKFRQIAAAAPATRIFKDGAYE